MKDAVAAPAGREVQSTPPPAQSDRAGEPRRLGRPDPMKASRSIWWGDNYRMARARLILTGAVCPQQSGWSYSKL